jgi:hypothetical protein
MLLSEANAKLVNSFLDKISAFDYAAPFLYPVDPVMYPSYYEKIKKPVDLSTIRERLYEYADLDAFERDFCLLISNCNTFNAKGSMGMAAMRFLWIRSCVW